MIKSGSRILISACLVGCKCNYKAQESSEFALDASFWERLFDFYQILPVCPEQLGGMSTPRIPCELQASADLVLSGSARVINRDGLDMTSCFMKGASEVLRLAKLFGAELAVLKSRSPSCGVTEVYDGTFSGRLIAGSGVTARLLADSGIKVVDDACFCNEMKVPAGRSL